MTDTSEYSADVTIRNRLGLHVRPVQRFAELARAFKADVEVQVRNRSVPGKSVMNLMSLGGRANDPMKITARGDDARQCVDVLRLLAENSFFVEDNVDVSDQPMRHVERLARIAACFDSEIMVTEDGKNADAKQSDALAAMGLTPDSRPQFEIHGDDQEQARAVVENLVRNYFYVEEAMIEAGREKT